MAEIRMFITGEQAEKITELRKQGKSYDKIVNETGFTRGQVEHTCRKNGLGAKASGYYLNEKEKIEIIRLWNCGYKMETIMERTGRSRNGIKKTLADALADGKHIEIQVEQVNVDDERDIKGKTAQNLKTVIGRWEFVWKKAKPKIKPADARYRRMRKGQPCLRTYYRPTGKW